MKKSWNVMEFGFENCVGTLTAYLVLCFLRECAVFLGCCSNGHNRQAVMFICANARSFWGVAAGEHCSDGLPTCYVFLRECAVFLGCCSWRTLQRWTACLVLFFLRGLFGVLQLANIAAMDCLPCFFARMCSHFGVLQRWTTCLLCFFA